MRAVGSGVIGAKILGALNDWKTPLELSQELAMPLSEVEATLRELVKKGAVLRDGNMYIRRAGRGPQWPSC